MADQNERDVRLEERTKALEKATGWHFIMETVLVLAFLALALIFVSGCRIDTPSLKVDKEKEKTWVYTPVVEVEGLTIKLEEDPLNVKIAHTQAGEWNIKTPLDSADINIDRDNYYYLKADFTDTKITVYNIDEGNKTVFGVFNYE